jgi:hypothetical protein
VRSAIRVHHHHVTPPFPEEEEDLLPTGRRVKRNRRPRPRPGREGPAKRLVAFLTGKENRDAH